MSTKTEYNRLCERTLYPANQQDVEHLLDLLALIQWDFTDGEPQIPDDIPLTLADQPRGAMLANGLIDYGYLISGSREDSTIYRMCMYVSEVFEDAPENLALAIGTRLSHSLGFRHHPLAVGRRWCDDVLATAWRIAVPHTAIQDRISHQEQATSE